MFKKINNNLNKTSVSSTVAVLPDPWDTPASETHFPSPLELDRLLRENHPLLGAVEAYPVIGSMEPPPVLLPLPHPTMPPTDILLQNELKLSPTGLGRMKEQLAEALALLYWSMASPEPSTV